MVMVVVEVVVELEVVVSTPPPVKVLLRVVTETTVTKDSENVEEGT